MVSQFEYKLTKYDGDTTAYFSASLSGDGFSCEIMLNTKEFSDDGSDESNHNNSNIFNKKTDKSFWKLW